MYYQSSRQKQNTMQKELHRYSLYFKEQEGGNIFIIKRFVISAAYQILVE
jgi:hypothetical protein